MITKIPNFQQHVASFVSLTNTMKDIHWATYDEKTHRYSEEILNSLQPLIDTFVESGSGKERIERSKTITLIDGQLSDVLSNVIDSIPAIAKDLEGRNDLLALLDEIETILQKGLYQVSLT